MLHLEFTIEPFVEGHPGPHVTAAVEAVETHGGVVEFGPFSSTCAAPVDEMPGLVASLLQAAFANGATHISMHVERGPETEGQP